jgi:hypothetical protein
MLQRPTVPCWTPSCRLPVLRDNDAFHVRPTGPDTYQLVQAHDLAIDPDDDVWEEIDEYD